VIGSTTGGDCTTTADEEEEEEEEEETNSSFLGSSLGNEIFFFSYTNSFWRRALEQCPVIKIIKSTSPRRDGKISRL